ncbi:unnamed protein product [Lymnaea stagnalis]|uniref:TNFR-Cys domain-containing protein n=1 Tax=Lymnaea stagnalis TaxID=6523 RepID=A0AAV2HVY6_LYMST
MTDVLKRGLFPIIVFTCGTIFISARDVCDPDIPSRPTPRIWVSLPIFENCGPGTYKDLGSGQCKQCPDSYFMTKRMAESSEYSFCEKCLAANSVETVAEPCTRTRDSVIHCKEGYYRRQAARNNSKSCVCCWECSRCDVCGVGVNLDLNYLIAECSTDSNTLCCHSESMVVVNGRCVHPTTVETLTESVQDMTAGFAPMEQESNSVARLDDAIALCVSLLFFNMFL